MYIPSMLKLSWRPPAQSPFWASLFAWDSNGSAKKVKPEGYARLPSEKAFPQFYLHQYIKVSLGERRGASVHEEGISWDCSISEKLPNLTVSLSLSRHKMLFISNTKLWIKRSCELPGEVCAILHTGLLCHYKNANQILKVPSNSSRSMIPWKTPNQNLICN